MGSKAGGGGSVLAGGGTATGGGRGGNVVVPPLLVVSQASSPDKMASRSSSPGGFWPVTRAECEEHSCNAQGTATPPAPQKTKNVPCTGFVSEWIVGWVTAGCKPKKNMSLLRTA